MIGICISLLILATASICAYAESVYNISSTGGNLGKIYYNLSAGNKYSSPGGGSMYSITASAEQVADNTGSYKPISSVTFYHTIYLSSGSVNTGSRTVSTTKNASYTSQGVYEGAVTKASEKGCVTISIKSVYYGTLTRTLKNN